jgi:hypothetical protein
VAAIAVIGVKDDQTASPAREPVLPPVRDRRGWPVLHRLHVTQAPEGCDYDFLQARTPDTLPFAEPVIGRS